MNDLTKQYLTVVKLSGVAIVSIFVSWLIFRTPELLGLLLGAVVGLVNMFTTYRGILRLTEQDLDSSRTKVIGTGSGWRILLVVLAVILAERSPALTTYTVVIGAFLAMLIAYITFLYKALLGNEKGGN